MDPSGLAPGRGAEATRTLVLGIGNPILGDDAVGWAVAGEVARQLAGDGQPGAFDYPSPPVPVGAMGVFGDVEVDCISLGGLALMERLVGYERAVLVDSVVTRLQPAGHVERHALGDLPDLSAGHTTSAHDTSLQTALATGRRMGALLPTIITVVTIEAVQVSDFAEEMTAEVAAAVPRATEVVLALLGPLTPRG
jgi:hydrogenase maturation protease